MTTRSTSGWFFGMSNEEDNHLPQASGFVILTFRKKTSTMDSKNYQLTALIESNYVFKTDNTHPLDVD
ncbi:hypothetical protein FWH30_00770 [Microgenomates group bacterium]|nr:hypothetical protein [Microgenomates group bacterium]